MRTRSLALVALLVLSVPAASTAQGGIRLPRGGRGTTPTTTAAPLPPEAPKVAQALAYRRSRWSFETYSLVNAIQVPAAGAGTGASLRYTTAGGGSHADYRVNDHFSATMDLTSTLPIGTSNAQTVETGSRFSPLDFTHRLRPFVDARAVYTRMTDTYGGSNPGGALVFSSNDVVAPGSRYTRGLGAFGGAGAEYSLTSRFAITSELSAIRNRMSTYRILGAINSPDNVAFWMTSYRLTLGLRFNPTSSLLMANRATP